MVAVEAEVVDGVVDGVADGVAGGVEDIMVVEAEAIMVITIIRGITRDFLWLEEYYYV